MSSDHPGDFPFQVPIEIATHAPWQVEFSRRYIAEMPGRAILVAAPGMGKTVMSMQLCSELFNRDLVDSVLLVSNPALIEQWKLRFRNGGISFAELGDKPTIHRALAVTPQELKSPKKFSLLAGALPSSRWLVIVDETHFESQGLLDLDRTVRQSAPQTKQLFLARSKPKQYEFEASFEATSELYSFNEVVRSRELKGRIERQSPSFPLIQSINRQILTLDSLSWREFERLTAELLSRDGYEVELMQGSKDGGVDVIGTKTVGAVGTFKVLLQAKKYSSHRKVGLSIVRELADTVRELRASKGVLITTSYLTSGALERIQLNRFTLGKLDRDDLFAVLRSDRGVA